MVRKGSRAVQQLPASPDAFVWLRLYQSGLRPAVPPGRDDPLWWTLRRPLRPLTYHAARAMFARAAAALGANWTLHDLRHTAAYRMARDPQLPLTDVQWVLGHAHLSTTQLYLTPMPGDVIAEVLAHHRRGRPSTVARSPVVSTECRSHPRGAERVPARLAGRAVRSAAVMSATVDGWPPPSGADRGRARGAWSARTCTAVAALPAPTCGAVLAGDRTGPARRCWPRLLAAPFTVDRDRAARPRRRLGWSGCWTGWPSQPGDTWQQRWLASGADDDGQRRLVAPAAGLGRGRANPRGGVSTSSNLRVCALLLVGADVIRPSLDWVLTPRAPQNLVAVDGPSPGPGRVRRARRVVRGLPGADGR